MIPFMARWRNYRSGEVPAGGRQPWSWLYYACLRIERAAAWCKVAAWRRSNGRPVYPERDAEFDVTEPRPPPCKVCGRPSTNGTGQQDPSNPSIAALEFRCDEHRPARPVVRRLLACVQSWPDCVEGTYDPRCCRFPKSCSCTVYDPKTTKDSELEPRPS